MDPNEGRLDRHVDLPQALPAALPPVVNWPALSAGALLPDASAAEAFTRALLNRNPGMSSDAAIDFASSMLTDAAAALDAGKDLAALQGNVDGSVLLERWRIDRTNDGGFTL